MKDENDVKDENEKVCPFDLAECVGGVCMAWHSTSDRPYCIIIESMEHGSNALEDIANTLSTLLNIYIPSR